jgi:tetratricopeptide (TPR) repeat protein
LLTVHSLKGDMFSARTLMVIHEGVEKLAKAISTPGNNIFLTGAHTTLFERLYKSFSNPSLLKEVGVTYLDQFHLPDCALKHFDLARQYAPNDRDIESLQVAAALAIAHDVTDRAGHSGIDEAVHAQPQVDAVLRKTTKLALVADTREHLDRSTGELGRLQEEARQTAAQRATLKLAVAAYRPLLDRAAGFLRHADYAGAAAALEEARKAGAPKEELQAGFAQVGLAAYDAGVFDAALAGFERVRDIDPGGVEGWFNCGLVLQKMARLDEALNSYQQALKISPDNPKTWCNLSSVWFELGRPGESETAAREALRLKMDYGRAWDNLASALSALNRLPEAANACQQAIRIQPAMHSAWFKFGVVNFQMENYIAAVEAFAGASPSEGYRGYVNYYLVMIDARKGELDAALAKLEDARAFDPDNELDVAAVKEIATAYTKQGEHLRAADFFRQVTKKHPDDFASWLALGTALHRANKLDRAREAYLCATNLRPDDPMAWHNLGLLASDQGKHEEARSFFQREVDLSPNDAKAWYDLAVSLQKLKRETEATAAFERSEGLVKSDSRRSSDLSAALSIVRRLNLSGRVLKTGD